MRTQAAVGWIFGVGALGLFLWWGAHETGPAREAAPAAVSTPAPSPLQSAQSARAGGRTADAARLTTELEAEIDEPLGGPVRPGEETAATASLRVDRIIEILEESYDDPSSQALTRRKLARDLLVALGADAVAPLLEASREADTTFRMEIQSIFGEIGPVAIAPLLNGLKHADDDVRQEASSALGNYGDQAAPAVRALLQAAKAGRNLELGYTALNAVAQVGRAAVPTLVQVLDDSDPVLRFYAAWVLGRIGPEASDSIAALERRLDQEDNESTLYIVRDALKKIERDG